MKYVLKQNEQYYCGRGTDRGEFLVVTFTKDVQQAFWFKDMASAEALNARLGLRFTASSVANEMYNEEEEE